jgi:hypothetical protein
MKKPPDSVKCEGQTLSMMKGEKMVETLEIVSRFLLFR